MTEHSDYHNDASSPRKQLRHSNYNNTSALLGWISFHSGTATPIRNLSQLDDGTALLRLLDVVTGFAESDSLKPLCISTEGIISSEIFTPISAAPSELSSLATPPVSPVSDTAILSAASSPTKKNGKKIKVINKELSRFQKLANIEIFMQWLNTSKLSPFNGVSKVSNASDINIRGVSALDILEANEKLVPGLLWSLFWEYTMFPSNINKNKQELLWLWIINHVSKFEDKKAKEIESDVNFKSTTWNDEGGLTNRLAVALGIIDKDDNKSIDEIFQIVYTTHKIPAFLDIQDLNSGVVDEWSIIAYFSCWFEIFNNDNDEESVPSTPVEETSEVAETAKKGEFSEFFGPNILNNASALAQHDYNMPLKLRIETFLVVSTKIIFMKNNFLSRLEKLLLEVVNLMGQFAEYESYDYESMDNTIPINQKYNPNDLKFKTCDLFELENRILNNADDEKNDLSVSLQGAIKSISFVLNFRKSTNEKIYEQFVELKIYQYQLTDMLRNYGLQDFVEPPEKSINKISKFLDLLKRSELIVFSNASDFIEKNLYRVIKSFNDNRISLAESFNLIEADILKANEMTNLEKRVKELNDIKHDIPGLKEFHLRTIIYFNEIEMINTSLGRGFNKQYYKSIINEQRFKLNFFEDCIENSLEFINSMKSQTNEASEVLQIAEIAQNYEQSQIKHGIIKDDDKIQLNTHLLVHKLIQKKFQFKKNIDPIQVLFDKHDTGSKGYLTKSEFKKAFLIAYPNTATLAGIDEVDTVFETSYETVGKMRRGIEYPQFRAVIELGNKGENNTNLGLVEDNNEESKEHVKLQPIDLTSNLFYNAFIQLSGSKDTLSNADLDKIHLNPMLKDKLESIFPFYKYTEWFKHVDQSSIYQDNEDCEDVEVGFGSRPKEIALKNVLYDLERVDLSKI